MQVSEIMTREVETIAPDASLQAAAEAMEAMGVGSLPVCDGKRLVGTITDRDIVVRAVAAGCSPVDALVKDCMTEDVAYAFCDEQTEEVLERMKVLQIRRLAVLDRDKNLAGIVALGDIATEPDAAAAGRVGAAVAEISEPSRPLK
jgi:CBS domain-containing protein